MEQSFTKVIDLIYLAKQDGIEIVLNDERLQLKIPDNKVIDKKLLEEIRSNKNQIIEFLSNENWKARTVSKNHNKIIPFDRKAVTRIPLSFSQERLWFIDQLEGSIQYNIPTVLRLKGQLNVEALSNALQTIVGRHEALRTAFGVDHAQPFQYIRDENEWKLNIIEGSHYQQGQGELQKSIDELIKKPFDLSKDYMMRADLIKLAAKEHVVVVTMHHIASDAWSLPIIVREVVELYKAYDEGRAADLPPLDIQYADFAVWQRENLQGELMERKINYWKTKLEDVAPLQLPTDYTRPPVKTIKGAITSSRIDKDLTAAIKTLAQQQGTSL
ncbi:MAG TPA: condensation domain-containing protein, partial [Flavitalea sp.]|nr:condensation domain-containing protein [Flavitalea sp.]